MKKLILLTVFLSSQFLQAATIDLNGAFRVDTTRINNYKRTSANTSTFTDSHVAKGAEENAAISTYIFRLNPEVIVNDHVTVQAELSTGFARGGGNGDNTVATSSSSNFVSQFFNTTPGNGSAVKFNQFFMEVYSDLATYKAGRFAKGWGLGALYNDGKNVEDRFFTVFDGIEAKFSLGNIFVAPYWAQLSMKGFTPGQQAREIGVSVLYDNPDNDQKLGILWSHRKSGSGNDTFVDANGPLDISITALDLYYQKYWDTFSVALEVPYLDGDIKNSTNFSGFKPAAYIAELGLEATNNLSLSLKGGYVSGDTNGDATKEDMFLNPNYKVSRLMFRYNYDAVENISGTEGNIYDAAISNASFARFGMTYNRGQWTWKGAVLWAKANEVVTGQSSDLGLEAEIGFEYLWNPKLKVESFLAYHLAGDYYAFSSAGALALKNPIAGGLALNLSF